LRQINTLVKRRKAAGSICSSGVLEYVQACSARALGQLHGVREASARLPEHFKLPKKEACERGTRKKTPHVHTLLLRTLYPLCRTWAVVPTAMTLLSVCACELLARACNDSATAEARSDIAMLRAWTCCTQPGVYFP